MSDFDRLTTRQRRFIAALLEAGSVREAAELAGISEPTAWRYLSDAGVQAELSRRTDGMLAQATAGLLADLGQARATLRAIMKNPAATDAARVSAARAVQSDALRLAELVDLARRVAELERNALGKEL